MGAITGVDGNHLKPYIAKAIEQSRDIRLIVSFVMESGVKILLPHLIDAANRGVSIRLLTGRYLSITEPSAIYLLYNHLGNAIDVRFYSDKLRSFHPKSYIFDYGSDGEIYVGSSNISRSALTSGVEWNFRFAKSQNTEEYQAFSDAFDHLFENEAEKVTPEVLKCYAMSWKTSEFVKVEAEGGLVDQGARLLTPEPRGAQIEALYHLDQARSEGVSKGVVVAATGVGKTHLAAFDSHGFESVLFLAHREEILNQAADTFASIRPDSQIGFYVGSRKDQHGDICFASVQTLSREEHLEKFSPEEFDYVVVDEFHHAAADSYMRIIAHFRPKFLLGLTATPYRLDNRDIFSICDGNILYEINLKQAIERELLVPFHYHAIYDPTDYDRVGMAQSRYIVRELEEQLATKERAELVFDSYKHLGGRKTVGFCVSINHAEYMARYFNEEGVASTAIHSQIKGNGEAYDRISAVSALEKGELEVIFVVDMFNEGVDIPSIDTVMFLRPTESYVVFLQQLGRGLRKSAGKQYLTVIDFIGNYKRAHYIPLLLAGENPLTASRRPRHPSELTYPDHCNIQFDFRIIDLFAELAERDPLPVRLRDTYWHIKDSLGRRPQRLDIYEASDIPIREYLRDGWLRFLDSLGELNTTEEGWLGTPAEDFLLEMEQTRFSKAYKIPTIAAFLSKDTMIQHVTLEDVGEAMMQFYHHSAIHQEDLNTKNVRRWRTWSVKEWTNLARKNPVHFLSKGAFFQHDEINETVCLGDALTGFLGPQLASHLRDILEYRRIDYFRKRF